jgi:hypothetical protein
MLVACSPSPPPPPAPSTSAVDGPALFAQNCALCHGAKGNGEGVVQTERKARSFVDGGFSFGNTPEALFRTISSGIGGTAMPAFSAVLKVEEIHALVKVVQGFAPAAAEVKVEDTVLVVKDQPLVVRGHLPALADGLPEHPRGLLIGHPDGLTYQYRADDLQLIAVRQGEYVERTDWGGRGGTPLKPLGKVAWLHEEANLGPRWQVEGNDQNLRVRLTGTSVLNNQAWVYGSLETENGGQFGNLAMSANPRLGNVGFERVIRFTSVKGNYLLRFKTKQGWVDLQSKQGVAVELLVKEDF